jgi:hypothetical protein
LSTRAKTRRTAFKKLIDLKMAQDGELPSSGDKGKGKAVDGDTGVDETQNSKDGKPLVNGKKDDQKQDCSCPPPAPASAV